MDNTESPSKFYLKSITIFIYALFAFGWLSVNIVMPVLPEMMKIFHASPALMKFSITAFLIGFAAFQLIWGPISDRIGRRKVIISGIVITMIGAFLASIATRISVFIIARFIEAVGMAAAPVIARAIMMDVFDSNKITKIVAISAVIVAIMPALDPIVGGWIAQLFSWHMILLFLVMYGFITLGFAHYRFKESHLQRCAPSSVTAIVLRYWECLRHKRFVSAIILYSLFFGGIIGFYTDSPFIFIEHLHYSKTSYGWLLLVPVIFNILGAALSRYLIKYMSSKFSILFSISCAVISAILLLLCNIFYPLTVLTVLVPMSIFIFGCGAMSPAANTIAMTVFTQHRGKAAALIGCAMSLGAAVFSSFLAVLHSVSLWPLCIMTTIIGIVAIIIYRRYMKEI